MCHRDDAGLPSSALYNRLQRQRPEVIGPASATRPGSTTLWPFVVAGIMRYLQITFVEHRFGPRRPSFVTSDPFLIACMGRLARRLRRRSVY